MKLRLVALFCLFDLTLLGVGYYWVSLHFENRLALDRAAAGDQLQKWEAQAVVVRATPALPEVIYKTNEFTWSQLESTNYRQYIANLRAFGCPEGTLRDIITTDLMHLYAGRRGRFYQNGRAFKYWETDEKRKLTQTQLDAREAPLALIDKELPAVLRELLGINYERELNKLFVDSDEDDRRYAFLDGDKRGQVLSLRDEFEGRRERVLWQSQNGKLTPHDLEQLRQIDDEQNTALRGVLTPEEKDELDLTSSPTADRMRRELIGFNPTEAEFRAIFRREQALDNTYASQDLSDDAVRAAKAADEQKMQADIAAELGPDRAAQYTQAQDPDYQGLCLLTQRFALAPDTSKTLLDMRRSAEDARSEIVGNPDISPDKRNEALQAIAAETERAARATLGDAAYAEYSRSASWLRGLGTP